MKNPEHIYQTHIRTTPQRLWEAITSPEFTRQYFHRMHIDCDWKPGSAVKFRYEDGRVGCEGTLLDCVPPKLLRYTWRFLFDEQLAKERPSTVTFEIEPAGENCRLRVTHNDFDADSKVFPMISEGWSEVISSLKSLLETGTALEVAGNPEASRGAA